MDYKVPPNISKSILEENMSYQITKTVFEKRYISLFYHLIQNLLPINEQEYKAFKKIDLQSSIIPEEAKSISIYSESFESWKIIFKFVCSSLLRIRKDPCFCLEVILQKLKLALEKSVGLSMWFAESFSHPSVLNEFLATCPLADTRFFIISLLLSACKTLLVWEQKKITKYLVNSDSLNKYILMKGGVETTNIDNEAIFLLPEKNHKIPHILILITNLLTMISTFYEKRKPMKEVFFFLAQIARLSPLIRKFFLNYNLLGALFEIIMENPSQYVLSLMVRRKIMIKKSLYDLGFQKEVATKYKPPTKKEQKVKLYRYIYDLFSQVCLIITFTYFSY